MNISDSVPVVGTRMSGSIFGSIFVSIFRSISDSMFGTVQVRGITTLLFLLSLLLLLLLLVLCTAGILMSMYIMYIAVQRQYAKYVLSTKCKLPTVMWLPKFINYHPLKDDAEADTNGNNGNNSNNSNNNYKAKMNSSSITNILPRMHKLQGPYGIYATVYGTTTKVVHVAHPIPAKLLLTGNCGNNSSNANNGINSNTQHYDSLGAVKAPAYNHFYNLFGNAVFTSDGPTWKAKRSSVIHCLLKHCTKDHTTQSQALEYEANYAADTFISLALTTPFDTNNCHYNDEKKVDNVFNDDNVVNVVKLLQRSTIGFIYRFLTHHHINTRLVHDNVNHGHSNDNNHCNDIGHERDDLTTESTSSSMSSSSMSSSSMSSSSCTSSSDEHQHNNKYIRNNHDQYNPLTILSSYLEAITNIRMIILAQSRSIWFLLPRWIYKLFSPMYKEEERQMTFIRQFATCACVNAQPGSPLHSLRFRNSHITNTTTTTTKKSTKKSTNNTTNNAKINTTNSDMKNVNKDLLDEAITLLFAGQDTSAATLSWTLHLLALYPKVQEKLAREVCHALHAQSQVHDNHHEHNSNTNTNANNTCIDTNISFFNVSKKSVINLPYLDAVLKESMRLYPVAPFVVRHIPNDITISPPTNVNGFNVDADADADVDVNVDVTLPKNSLACIWIYGLHRNPKFWHKPNDFIPERWIDPKIQKLDLGQKNGSFMPFAAGPRNCVGQPLAHIVLRMILAKIIYVCEFHDRRVDDVLLMMKQRKKKMREGLGSGDSDNGNDEEEENEEEQWKDATMYLRKDMQAGFTVLPTGGVHLHVTRRKQIYR